MSRYLEHLIRGTATVVGGDSNSQKLQEQKKQDDVFETLCDVIAHDAQQSEIAEELRIELKAERGELVIEEHVRKEV